MYSLSPLSTHVPRVVATRCVTDVWASVARSDWVRGFYHYYLYCHYAVIIIIFFLYCIISTVGIRYVC